MSPRTDVVAAENFLIPNGTFFVELLIFLIVLGVIWFFVVPPIRKVLEEREERAAETLATTKEARQLFAEAEAKHHAAVEKTRSEAAAIRSKARAEGREILEEMRGQAQQEANGIVAEAEAQLRAQADQIAAELRETVEPLARSLADRVVGVDDERRAETSRGRQTGRASS
ncbi:F0F1 ATP synthase subunit B [Nocardia colli]|uniref:ATP synthase subunit b n=1 Tax=Nocardia colli TaxID=2545717 RepID=A0A5N0DSJ0_9NOCA|nr:F0F1 ATP synthase subunit B [Nocardia colli]KAA8880038.1 F0F1 ATP synthase subunit B [Nocardia colli]